MRDQDFLTNFKWGIGAPAVIPRDKLQLPDERLANVAQKHWSLLPQASATGEQLVVLSGVCTPEPEAPWGPMGAHDTNPHAAGSLTYVHAQEALGVEI